LCTFIQTRNELMNLIGLLRKCGCDVKYDWFKWGRTIKYTQNNSGIIIAFRNASVKPDFTFITMREGCMGEWCMRIEEGVVD